jgi:tRNA G46 methylase TrmB
MASFGLFLTPSAKRKKHWNIGIEYARDALAKCHKIAQETGLANMTMEEINGEIQAVNWSQL